MNSFLLSLCRPDSEMCSASSDIGGDIGWNASVKNRSKTVFELRNRAKRCRICFTGIRHYTRAFFKEQSTEHKYSTLEFGTQLGTQCLGYRQLPGMLSQLSRP